METIEKWRITPDKDNFDVSFEMESRAKSSQNFVVLFSLIVQMESALKVR